MKYSTTAWHRSEAQGATQTKGGKKHTWDKNLDGRIDVADLMIWLRTLLLAVFSWYGAMVVGILIILWASMINIGAWSKILHDRPGLPAGTAIVAWIALQTIEVIPMIDDLDLKASFYSLLKLQRKPPELPVVNSELNPESEVRLRRYKRRGENSETVWEFVRYAAYGCELAVLIGLGGIVTSTGFDLFALVSAVFGMVGVEGGLRLATFAGENLPDSEERVITKSAFNNRVRMTAPVPGEKTNHH